MRFRARRWAIRGISWVDNQMRSGVFLLHSGWFFDYRLVCPMLDGHAVEQIMGRARPRQIKAPEIALAHGNGGFLSSQATVISRVGRDRQRELRI
jgi:hypothetical protein